MKSKLILLSSVIALVLASTGALIINNGGVGADAVTPIAGQTYTLAGSGISSTATEFDLVSFTIPQSGVKIQDAQMSETFYVTFEPGSRSRQEIASCTTVVQNSDGTATISGCTRGLSPITPYTASTSLQFAHNGGTSVIFSNPPQLYNQAAFKDNDETITGSWNFPTPSGGFNAATKSYVDSIVNGGTVSYDQIIVAGQAGETMATGTLVYFNGADQEWYKVDVDSTSTYVDKYLGITQGTGVNGGTITGGGVLVAGLDQTQTGMTAGSVYYAAGTAGAITTSVTAQPIGVAEDTNKLYFQPQLLLPTEAGSNAWTGTNSFSATTTFTGRVVGAVRRTEYLASSTYAKPSGLAFLVVEAWGGGGGGETNSSAIAGGGGGGAYKRCVIDPDAMAATNQILIAAGGAGGTSAGDGGNTIFGDGLCIAYGGQGAKGGGSGGTGGYGGFEATNGSSTAQGSITGAVCTAFGSCYAPVNRTATSTYVYGGGGGSTDGSTVGAGGSSIYGGGGGGSARLGQTASAGTSKHGGAGGAGAASGNASNGTVPGGGGGGAYNGTGGNGARGKMIIYEYF